MSNDGKICLGYIAGVHGIKGEVKVKSFTENDRDIANYGVLEDQFGRQHEIKVVGHSKELLRVKLKGVEDRNLAETLIGTQFFVSRDVLPKLEDEDEFYQADLIGLKVKLIDSEIIVGEVDGVYDFGAGDILDIKIIETGKSEMIPFTKAYVPVVDIKNGYIIVSSVSIFSEDDGEE